MSKPKRKIKTYLNSAYQKVSELKDDSLSGVSKLGKRRFCIGITGLSKSGKSTFITSLINQLLLHDNACLSGFSPVLSERLLGVKMLPLEDKGLADFPYETGYKGMTGESPQWPASTRNISGCLLELSLERPVNKLNPFKRERFSLFLEIRDYPGEWLLDLPLREMTFARWSAQCNAQYAQSPRAELLGELLAELQQIDPLAEVDEPRFNQLNQRFVKFLQDCKYKGKSLSLIQPGRFLIPGDISDPEVLCFIPLLGLSKYSAEELDNANENSYFKRCEGRYLQYVKQLVDPFYKTFFSHIDRQLVLVDVVNALNAGPDYIDDMRQALTNITDSFSYGKQNRLFQLFNPKIDKVVFAATKIDQVLSEDHEAVRQLLGVLVKQAYRNAQHEGIQPICEATAAVRSSKEVLHRGERGITGTDDTGNPIGYIHPTIPGRIPEGDEWQPFKDWKIPALNPPKGLSYQNSDVIPHIRIDSILNALIGDKCL